MISVIIPAYNEEENIESIYKNVSNTLNKINEEYEILFVDDGGTDSTNIIIKRLAKTDKHVKLFKHTINLGLGAALQTGFKNASGDVIITIDADMTHDVNLFSNFIKEVRAGNDIVIGSRYIDEGKMLDVPFWRVIISKFAGFAFSLIFNIFDVKDKTSGYRAYSKLVKKINIRSKGYPMLLETLVKMKRIGAKTKEIPIRLVMRKKGKSKFKLLKVGWDYFKTVFSLKFS